MQFKQWLILSESVQANLKNWLDSWAAYLQKNDPDTLKEVKPVIDSMLVDTNKQNMIKQALTSTTSTKNHDNQNYFRYLIGFATTKPNFRVEDLQRALDAVDWMLQTNKLTNTQASTAGWYNVGKNAPEYIKEKETEGIIAAQPSKTQQLKMKKAGIAPDELTPIAKSKEYKLYMVNGVDPENKAEVNKKHMMLCKYGKGSNWCTADPTGTYHEQYAKNNIFILHQNDQPMYQFAKVQDDVNHDTLQFMNKNDQLICVVEPSSFKFLLEHTPYEVEFYNLIPDLSDSFIKMTTEAKKVIFKNYINLLNGESEKYEEVESEIATDVVANLIETTDDLAMIVDDAFMSKRIGKKAEVNMAGLEEFMDATSPRLYKLASRLYPEEFFDHFRDQMLDVISNDIPPAEYDDHNDKQNYLAIVVSQLKPPLLQIFIKDILEDFVNHVKNVKDEIEKESNIIERQFGWLHNNNKYLQLKELIRNTAQNIIRNPRIMAIIEKELDYLN
jgi:hypothetical protein